MGSAITTLKCPTYEGIKGENNEATIQRTDTPRRSRPQRPGLPWQGTPAAAAVTTDAAAPSAYRLIGTRRERRP